MTDIERLISEMFARVVEYGAAEGAAFPARTLGATLFADLSAIHVELNSHAARQSSATGSVRQGTATKSEARENLREDLEAIDRTTRAMAEVMTGLDDKFRFPRGKVNDQQLLAAAQAAAADAPAWQAAFIEYGMPADFLEDLNADIVAFQAATGAQSSSRRQRVAATAAIDDLIERGMKIVRRLDAIVRNTFRDDPAKLAAWESARHVERLPRRRKETTPQPPTPPQP